MSSSSSSTLTQVELSPPSSLTETRTIGEYTFKLEQGPANPIPFNEPFLFKTGLYHLEIVQPDKQIKHGLLKVGRDPTTDITHYYLTDMQKFGNAHAIKLPFDRGLGQDDLNKMIQSVFTTKNVHTFNIAVKD